MGVENSDTGNSEFEAAVDPFTAFINNQLDLSSLNKLLQASTNSSEPPLIPETPIIKTPGEQLLFDAEVAIYDSPYQRENWNVIATAVIDDTTGIMVINTVTQTKVLIIHAGSLPAIPNNFRPAWHQNHSLRQHIFFQDKTVYESNIKLDTHQSWLFYEISPQLLETATLFLEVLRSEDSGST